jgi:uncharacterized protein (DUF885 family)
VLLLSKIESSLLSLGVIRDWKRDPGVYFEDALFSIFILLSGNHASPSARVENAIARLNQLPNLLASGRANLENPPLILLEIARDEVKGAIEFCRDTIPHFSRQALRLRRKLLVATQRAEQSLREYEAFLTDDLSLTAHGRIGIGVTNYRKLLRAEHLIDESPAELSRRARQVYDESLIEMQELADEINPVMSWQEVLDVARRKYPKPGRLLGVYQRELRRLRKFIQEHDLVTMPSEECEVVETPTFDRALNSFAAYVEPGPFERTQVGQFWVTPIEPGATRAERLEVLAEHCNSLYPITAAHEAYPGHHVQLVRANKVGSRWRRHFSSSLFAEGWALYCERLMVETGYFKDPITRLFQLRNRLWRAARVIGEIALHCEGATIEQVAEFLVRDVGMTPTSARAETRRYAAEPMQPMSYLIGELEVLKLRKNFRHLSLKKFHDALLSSGTIPFKLVEREMALRFGTGDK